MSAEPLNPNSPLPPDSLVEEIRRWKFADSKAPRWLTAHMAGMLLQFGINKTPDFSATMPTDEEVDQVHDRVFLVEFPLLARWLSRGFIGQMLVLSRMRPAGEDRDKVRSTVVSFLTTVERILPMGEFGRENMAAVRARALAEIFPDESEV